jgi:hypothetical protein
MSGEAGFLGSREKRLGVGFATVDFSFRSVICSWRNGVFWEKTCLWAAFVVCDFVVCGFVGV